jgi:hypothetical protein
MDKEKIANEFRDMFFTPILTKTLSEAFEDSGFYCPELFVNEIMVNTAIQSKIKAKMAIGISQKYTELGFPTFPDDIEIIIKETGIEAINLKIDQDKE